MDIKWRDAKLNEAPANESVLVTCVQTRPPHGIFIGIAELEDGEVWAVTGHYLSRPKVTHWAPLPEQAALCVCPACGRPHGG